MPEPVADAGAGRARRPVDCPEAVTRIAARRPSPDRPGYGSVRARCRFPAAPEGPRPAPDGQRPAGRRAEPAVDRWNTAQGLGSGQIRITVPVNKRDPEQRWPGSGNQSRLIRVSATSRERADPAVLLAQVAAQTRAGKRRRRAGMDTTSRLLAAGWAPAIVKQHAARLARRLASPVLTDTSLVTNLGVVPDPPRFGGPREQPLWIPAPLRCRAACPSARPRSPAACACPSGTGTLCWTSQRLRRRVRQAVAELTATPSGHSHRGHSHRERADDSGGIALALLATVVYNVGFVLEKRALTNLPPIDAGHMGACCAPCSPPRPGWRGSLLIFGGLILQVLVLSLEPLTVAQPLQASGLVGTIVLSRLVLHERPGGR